MEFYDIFFPIRSGLCLDTKFSKFNYIVVLENHSIFEEWLHLWVCSYLSMNNVPYCIQTTYLFIYESWDLWVLLLSAVMNNASMTLCVYPYVCVTACLCAPIAVGNQAWVWFSLFLFVEGWFLTPHLQASFSRFQDSSCLYLPSRCEIAGVTITLCSQLLQRSWRPEFRCSCLYDNLFIH